MKIAFTTSGNDLSAPMDPRFGRAAQFLVYDTDQKSHVIVANANAVAAQGAGIKAAETIFKAGAVTLITGDCGPKALNALKQSGIKIYTAKSMSVAEALMAFEAGNLTEITSA
ncbi:MAG: NifB/NifX family molybdenum-iron cluster-binding protein [Alphaproteobacteria bacterium]|nr:NifB/NifX family molybdenum-iron cluster-binding protein [Alphaproteobacteria bacterium]